MNQASQVLQDNRVEREWTARMERTVTMGKRVRLVRLAWLERRETRETVE